MIFLEKLVEISAQMAVLLLLTRVFLSPEEYGLLFLAISIFSICQLISVLGIHKSAARYISEYKIENKSQVFHIVKTSGIFVTITTLSVALLLSVFSPYISEIYGEPDLQPLLLLGVSYVIFYSIFTYLHSLFQGFGRVPLSGVQGIVRRISEVVFIVSFLLLGFEEIGALGGFIVGLASGTVLGIYFLYRILQQYPSNDSIEPGLRRRVAEYSIPLTASRSADILYKKVDTLMVGFFLSPLAVGFYELAKQVSMAVQSPANSLGFSAAPTYSEQKASGKLQSAAQVYEQTFEYILLLYLPTAAGIILLAEPGIQYVFGSDYLGAAPVLMVFSGFILFQAIDKITNDSLDYLGRARERAIGKAITGISNFLLNLWLIPNIGVVGAAISTVFSFGTMVIYNLHLINIELPIKPSRLLYSLFLTSSITLVMAIIVLILKSFISGIISLFLVISAGVLVWGALSFILGIIELDKISDYI